MLLLAAWLLWLNFRSPTHRAFAVFLVLRAAVIVANRLRGLAEDAGQTTNEAFWESLREYYFLALAPALVYFWAVYATRPRPRVWLLVVLAATLLLESLYLVDHCSNYCTLAGGTTHLGPLSPFGSPASLVVQGVIGLLVLREAGRAGDSSRGRAAFAVAMSLLLEPMLEGALIAGFVWRVGLDAVLGGYQPYGLAIAFHALFFVAALAPIAGVAMALLAGLRSPGLRVRAEMLAALTALMAVSGLYVGWNVVRGVDWLPGIFLIGVWRILLPALAVYALVRHGLFGVDVRLRFAIKGTTLAGCFLAVFFVVNKVTENLVAARFDNNHVGVYVGGVVAGLLLFVLSPLQRVAERFSQAVLPNSTPVSSMTHPERLDLFREQAMLVWRDGRMGRKERALLDGLRARLAIPFEEAARIEAQAAAGSRSRRHSKSRPLNTA